jgi:hypothetical protein
MASYSFFKSSCDKIGSEELERTVFEDDVEGILEDDTSSLDDVKSLFIAIVFFTCDGLEDVDPNIECINSSVFCFSSAGDVDDWTGDDDNDWTGDASLFGAFTGSCSEDEVKSFIITIGFFASCANSAFKVFKHSLKLLITLCHNNFIYVSKNVIYLLCIKKLAFFMKKMEILFQ